MYILRFSVWCLWWFNCPGLHLYTKSVNLFRQVYVMLDLDLASWAALVAQLVRSSVRSAECRGFKSHLRQLIFHFSFASGACLSFFPSQVIMCNIYGLALVYCIYWSTCTLYNYICLPFMS